MGVSPRFIKPPSCARTPLPFTPLEILSLRKRRIRFFRTVEARPENDSEEEEERETPPPPPANRSNQPLRSMCLTASDGASRCRRLRHLPHFLCDWAITSALYRLSPEAVGGTLARTGNEMLASARGGEGGRRFCVSLVLLLTHRRLPPLPTSALSTSEGGNRHR